MFKVTPTKIECTKCGHVAHGMNSHVDRYHKKCGKSKAGEPRKTHGKWVRAAALLLALIGAQPTFAEEIYITGGIGASIITALPPDGTWHQDALPRNEEHTSLGYKAGLGYRWERVYIEANYLSMNTFSTQATWVPDSDYDATNHIALSTERTYQARMTDTFKGGELVLGYALPLSEWISTRIHVGAWGGSHTIRATQEVAWSTPSHQEYKATGMQLGGSLGGGACLGPSWQICGDVTYYKSIAETKFAAAKASIMPMITLSVPFGGLL